MILRTMLLLLTITSVACATADPIETELSDAERAQLLWNEIQDHQSWGQFPNATGVVVSAMPHAAYAETFVNSVGMTNVDEPPFGTIIVKRNVANEDGSGLDALTVMQRIEGYNTEANDWFWTKFDASGTGTVAMNGMGTALMGAPGGCIGCHGGYDDADYVVNNN